MIKTLTIFIFVFVSSQLRAAEDSASNLSGHFDYTIPNFKGIPQGQSLWCWDAAVATMIRSVTGATIDQAKLAAIHFTYPQIVTGYLDRIAWIDPEDCHAVFANTPRCNHRGNSASALAFLGKAFPWGSLPSPSNPAAIFERIRESLQKNFPVGIQVDWDTGNSHTIVIYGARFETENFQTELQVYDPLNNQYSVVQDGYYSSTTTGVTGHLTWNLSMMNDRSRSIKKFTPKLCEFLKLEDQIRFCK